MFEQDRHFLNAVIIAGLRHEARQGVKQKTDVKEHGVGADTELHRDLVQCMCVWEGVTHTYARIIKDI